MGLTMGVLFERWLQTKKTKVKESTCGQYRYLWEHYLAGEYAAAAPETLTGAQVSCFLQQDGNMSASIRNGCLTILKSVLKTAAIYLPVENQAEVSASSQLKQSQMNDFLWRKLEHDLAQEKDTRVLGVSLALFMGLKIGEICAIQAGDIDWEHECLHIRRTVLRVPGQAGAKKTRLLVDASPSASFCRKVPIPAQVTPLLRKACKGLSPETYVSSGGEKPLDPRTLQYRLHKYLQSCGIPTVSFNRLRQRFAEKCADGNMDVRVLSEIMGYEHPEGSIKHYAPIDDGYKIAQMRMG